MDGPDVYQILPPDRTAQETDPLGLWQALPREGSLEAGAEAPGVIWRADLPEDPLEALSILNGQALALRQTRRALSAVGPLLAQDLAQATAGGAAGAHFALDGGTAFSEGGASARRTILAQALSRAPQEVAFGGLRDELAEASQAAGRLAALVRRLVEQHSLVESSRGGIPLARTRLDWLGNLHTLWKPGRLLPGGLGEAGPFPGVESHRRLLAQALATRQAWLRLLLVLTSGAAKIGLLTASGPFAPAALWAAWNYAQDVIRQFRQLAATVQVD